MRHVAPPRKRGPMKSCAKSAKTPSSPSRQRQETSLARLGGLGALGAAFWTSIGGGGRARHSPTRDGDQRAGDRGQQVDPQGRQVAGDQGGGEGAGGVHRRAGDGAG